MTKKRKTAKAPAQTAPNNRLSYALRGPPVQESISVPGYADMVRHMLARLLELRKSGPISRMDAAEFQHALNAVQAWIAKADSIAGEASKGGFAIDAYRCYCDQARAIIHDVRADAWIDPHRATQRARAKNPRRPAAIDSVLDEYRTKDKTARELWPMLYAAFDSHDTSIKDVSTGAEDDALAYEIEVQDTGEIYLLTYRNFQNIRSQKSR